MLIRTNEGLFDAESIEITPGSFGGKHMLWDLKATLKSGVSLILTSTSAYHEELDQALSFAIDTMEETGSKFLDLRSYCKANAVTNTTYAVLSDSKVSFHTCYYEHRIKNFEAMLVSMFGKRSVFLLEKCRSEVDINLDADYDTLAFHSLHDTSAIIIARLTDQLEKPENRQKVLNAFKSSASKSLIEDFTLI